MGLAQRRTLAGRAQGLLARLAQGSTRNGLARLPDGHVQSSARSWALILSAHYKYPGGYRQNDSDMRSFRAEPSIHESLCDRIGASGVRRYL